MRKLRYLPFGISLSLTLILGGLSSTSFGGNTALPLQTPTAVDSPLKTVDDAIKAMYVSDPYKSTSALGKGGVDLLEKELSEINRFIDAPGNPEKKKIVLVRYGVDDPRVMDSLIRAKEKKIPVQFVTDLNQSMSFDFKGPEKFTTHFAEAKITSGEMGAAIQKLLDAGFKFNDPTYGIYSQPLFRKDADNMIPIMHEKALFLIDESGSQRKIQHFHGTANMTDNPRYNRMFEIQDPQAIDYYLAHAEEMIKTFHDGGEISDIKTQPPLRITYKDGTIQEIAFTDGKYNPNDRIAAVFKKAVDDPSKVKIKSAIFSQFVLTNKDVVDNLKAATSIGKGFDTFGVFDDRFIDLDGYGLSPTLEGFDVHRQFGGTVQGVSPEMMAHMNFYAYQSPAIDPKTGKIRVETTTEGPPRARKVWHDKTTYIETEVEGKPRTFIFSGSLNNSGHFANAEVQTMFMTNTGSPLADAFKESIVEVAKSQPQYVIPFRQAVTRNAIADITGNTDLEVPIERAAKIQTAVLGRDFATVLSELKAQAKVPTRLTAKVSPKEQSQRIATIQRFFEWYAKNIPPSGAAEEARLRRFAGMALLVSKKTLAWSKQEDILRSVLQRPGLDSDKLEKLVTDGWQALKGDMPLPSTMHAPVIYSNFDWDDNVMRMGTKIVIFEKDKGTELEVSTAEFAEIREQLGKSGKWKNYELRTDDRAKGSFRYFSSGNGENYFLSDLKTAIKKSPKEWQAPAWKSFATALENEETAKNVSIITARGQSVDDIMAGLEFLKDKGLIKTLPPKENIAGVGKADNPSLAKTVVMKKSLEELQGTKIDPLSTKILNQAGDHFEQLHLWTFSDDDPGNFKTALSELSKDVKAGKYPNVKIALYYTGQADSSIPQANVVIQNDGTPREMQSNELRELFNAERRIAASAPATAAQPCVTQQVASKLQVLAPSH